MPKSAAHAFVQSTVLESPRVVPIYWDAHFRRKPLDVVVFDVFLRTLFRSSWMTELHENGIASVRLLPSVVPADRAPATLTAAQLKQRLLEWIVAGALTPKPRADDRSLTYLLFTPLGTELPRVTSRSDASLSYAVVPLVSTGPEILEVHSRAVSEELARVFLGAARRPRSEPQA